MQPATSLALGAARVDRQLVDGAADRLASPVAEQDLPAVVDLDDAHARVLHDRDGVEAGAEGFREPLLGGAKRGLDAEANVDLFAQRRIGGRELGGALRDALLEVLAQDPQL